MGPKDVSLINDNLVEWSEEYLLHVVGVNHTHDSLFLYYQDDHNSLHELVVLNVVALVWNGQIHVHLMCDGLQHDNQQVLVCDIPIMHVHDEGQDDMK